MASYKVSFNIKFSYIRIIFSFRYYFSSSRHFIVVLGRESEREKERKMERQKTILN